MKARSDFLLLALDRAERNATPDLTAAPVPLEREERSQTSPLLLALLCSIDTMLYSKQASEPCCLNQVVTNSPIDDFLARRSRKKYRSIVFCSTARLYASEL